VCHGLNCFGFGWWVALPALLALLVRAATLR